MNLPILSIISILEIKSKAFTSLLCVNVAKLHHYKTMKYKFYIQAGNGGNGCSSLCTGRGNVKYGPDGGNGGNGGNVLVQALSTTRSLRHLIGFPHIKAQTGISGRSNNRHGANGDDVILHVPLNTMLELDNGDKIHLTQHNQQLIIAHGGKGGLGNAAFKTSNNQSPIETQSATAGEYVECWMSLVYKVDVLIIGKPNSGKTTLLNRICGTNFKVADYPCTTTTLQLATVYIDDQPVIFAEMPTKSITTTCLYQKIIALSDDDVIEQEQRLVVRTTSDCDLVELYKKLLLIK